MVPTRKKVRGFTLLELLIVIGVLAILAVILVTVINPIEILRKSRDAQRISDLNSIKSAIGLYITNTTSPILGGADNAACKTGASYAAGDKIFYSTSTGITDADLDGSALVAPITPLAADLYKVDNAGWIPINFAGIAGGSPIASLPTDPLNTLADANNLSDASFLYRYVCGTTNYTFEIDAVLESATYKTDEDRDGKDGGDNANFYEVGTDLSLLGSTNTF